jgi:uncharacterized protein
MDSKKVDQLCLACQKGDSETVTELTKKRLFGTPIDVNSNNAAGESPLRLALMARQTEIAEFLLRMGADVNARCHGEPIICAAAAHGETKAVEFLLSHGADVNCSSEGTYAGYTALHHAVSRSHGSLVKLLIEKSADVNATTQGGTSALRMAAQSGSKEVLNMLLGGGADVKKSFGPEGVVVGVRVTEECLEVVGMLRSQGVDAKPDIPTLLLKAVRQNDISALRYCLERGGDAKQTDAEGFALLHYAASGDVKDAAKVLVERGADLNARSKKGVTPIQLALKLSHADMAALLHSLGAQLDSPEDVLFLKGASITDDKIRALFGRCVSLIEETRGGIRTGNPLARSNMLSILSSEDAWRGEKMLGASKIKEKCVTFLKDLQPIARERPEADWIYALTFRFQWENDILLGIPLKEQLERWTVFLEALLQDMLRLAEIIVKSSTG